MIKTLLLLTISCYSYISTAQLYQLTEYDIAPGGFGSRPHNLYIYNGKVHFFATDSLQGKALWNVSQTGQPTLVRDINPSTFTFPTGNANQQLMATVSNKLYFRTEHINYGDELWVYDGVNNPVLIKDIVPGTISSTPTFLTQLNNKLYFAASDSTTTSGMEIFEFNESTGDIIKRSNILQAKLYSAISQVSAYDGRLVFSAANDLTGSEVFLYDPKVKISWMLANIAEDNLSAFPSNYVQLNGKLFFTATDAINGMQLYMYDGVYAPKRITALDSLGIHPSGSQGTVAVFNNRIYFTTHQYNMYTYNPASGILFNVTNTKESFTSIPNSFIAHNNKLYFTASGSISGTEIWVCDTANVLQAVTDLADHNSYPTELTFSGDYLFFSAGGDNGRELYKLYDSALSVTSIKHHAAIMLYPNPTKDVAHLNISLNQSQSLNFSLTDMNGRLVYKTDNVLYSASKHTIEIPMHNIPTGNYIYAVKSNDGIILNTGKLQKL